jgi:hypothetical protein
MDWATFWAIFSQTHLVTLIVAALLNISTFRGMLVAVHMYMRGKFCSNKMSDPGMSSSDLILTHIFRFFYN